MPAHATTTPTWRRSTASRRRARKAEAFNRGDLDTWIGLLADDIDYRALEGAPDDHGPIHGKDAVRAYVQDWQDTFDVS
ncbi:MAG: nuclear transport factor 2 family protein [Gaiellaceae bacterium]